MSDVQLAVADSNTASLEADWDTFCAIESEVGEAEHQGIEARWRCGRMLLRYEKRERSKNSPLADAVRRLSAEFSLSEAELYNRRQFAEEYPNCSTAVEQFGSWTEIRDSLGEREATTHVSNNSGDNEWFTPEPYIQAARQIMGAIDLDPASSPTARQAVSGHRRQDPSTHSTLVGRAGRGGGLTIEFARTFGRTSSARSPVRSPSPSRPLNTNPSFLPTPTRDAPPKPEGRKG